MPTDTAFITPEKNHTFSELRLILGDQLNASHSWFKTKNKHVLYLMAECHDEAQYCQHHIQKVAAFFAAMRAFAKALVKAGHQVMYLTLDDTVHGQSIKDILLQAALSFSVSHIAYQRPDEYRLSAQLSTISNDPKLRVNLFESEHFLLPFEDIEQLFPKDNHVRMETFYRKMRTRFNILMQGDKPVGAQWNYDQQNRNKLPAKAFDLVAEPLVFGNDIQDILAMLARHNIQTMGGTEHHIVWPVTRQQAQALLVYFCEHLLPHFGTYQDAMSIAAPHSWSLFHSRLSFALNSKMLHPMQVINAALEVYRSGDADIAQVEGFIRQILGWREYVRGVYWANMPEYAEKNSLHATKALPRFFWDGKTGMQCLSTSITQSLEYAYAHHIQRLMITGNFCLLAGIDPDQVDEWYLGIYIDAIEWVEMPNTRGMSQFADGGLIATKPYAASANYVNKMSDYCKHCRYDPKLKYGENACPLNSLYWRFLDRHQDELAKNHRTKMMFTHWNKMSAEEKEKILKQADDYLTNIESL